MSQLPSPPPPPPPPPPPRSVGVPFTVFDAGMALLAYFVGQLVVGLALGVGIGVFGVELDDTGWMVVAVGATVVGLLFGLGWLALRGRLDRRLWGTTRPGLLTVAFGVAVGLAGSIVTYTVNGLVGLLFEPDQPVEQQLLQDALMGGTSLVLAVLVAVVLAPIAEEILFRGVLFQALQKRIGLWPAAITTSFVFALVHVEIVFSQPLALIGLFVFGVVLAWSFHRTRSLLVPVLGHAIFNAISLTLVLVLDRMGLLM